MKHFNSFKNRVINAVAALAVTLIWPQGADAAPTCQANATLRNNKCVCNSGYTVAYSQAAGVTYCKKNN